MKLPSFAAKFLSMPRAAVVLLAASVGALGFALITQHVFGFDPCVLCLWQRVPYALAAFFALLAFLIKSSKARAVLVGLIIVCFLTGCGLAIFHTGVELHWWLGTDGCKIIPLTGAVTPDDLRTRLLGTPAAHCDEISWTFLGLSMANWNVAVSLILAVYSFFVLRKIIKS